MMLFQKTARLCKDLLKSNKGDFPACSQNRPPAPEFLIDLQNVVKTYQTPAGPFTALRSIDLQVKAGEFTAVIGKSGSGKSTLINMVTGIDRPSLGTVTINGVPIQALSEDDMAGWRARNVGVIFQFFQLLPTLTLLENVMLPLEISQLYPRSEHLERAMHLLERVGMADQAGKFPAAVSGGQQQRVAIARALVNDPAILIADEPTGSLDSKTGDAIFHLFEEFVETGHTILMVTHDRSLASRVSRVVYIADGEIVDEAVAEALPHLNPAQQVELLAHLETETYAPGATIIRQGDPADTFYIIARGEAEVVMTHPGGREILLARLQAGHYFGEIGLLEGGVRTATVRVAAEAEATVMQLGRNIFARIVAESNLTGEQVAHLMRRRAIRSSIGRALPTLTAAQLAALPDDLEVTTYRPGGVIVREGDPPDKFYIVVEGEVEVIREEAAGRAAVQARLQAGHYFGEISLLCGRTCTRTVRAAEDSPEVKIVSIGSKTFQMLVSESQLTYDEVAQVTRHRLKELLG